jgi:phage terminase large subunit-like protein
VGKYGLYHSGQLYFPERLTEEFLVELRASQGAYIYNCQYMLNPVDMEKSDLKREWLRYYRGHLEGELGAQNLVIDWLGDYKKETIKGYTFPITMPVTIVSAVDPNHKKKTGRDYTGAVTIGLPKTNEWFVLEILRDKLSPTEVLDLMFSLHEKYMGWGVGVEEVGREALMTLIKNRMKDTDSFFRAPELSPRGISKEDRISARLIPRFESGMIYLPVTQVKATKIDGQSHDMIESFEDEYTYFPKAKNDDILDALAYIEDLVNMIRKSKKAGDGRRQGNSRILGRNVRKSS